MDSKNKLQSEKRGVKTPNQSRMSRFAANTAKSSPHSPLEDPYTKSYQLPPLANNKTLYAYHANEAHNSPFQSAHPENPCRSIEIDKHLQRIIEHTDRIDVLNQINLIDIPDNELLGLVHTNLNLATIKKACETKDARMFEKWDSVYGNGSEGWKEAILAARIAVTMGKMIAEGTYLNGFANIRPPGHHAMPDEPNGYCLFNNVAITAKYLLANNLAERILIVDFDVHHGQGIQRIFYDSNKVLYFSIHRYQFGQFWPNLRESNFDHIGEGDGLGFNVNVPLNEVDCNDYDYMAIIINILLPLAYEFNPSIVLVSAGYDACMGCSEGLMRVTPSFYSHLITQLMGLAYGKVLVVLEGGYYIPTLVEGAKQTVNALIAYPCAPLEYHVGIKPSVIDSINNAKIALLPYWDCFRKCEKICQVEDLKNYDWFNEHYAIAGFDGKQETAPFPLQVSLQDVDPVTCTYYMNIIMYLQEIKVRTTTVGYAVNPMSRDHDVHNPKPLETEERLDYTIRKLKEFGLLKLMKEVKFKVPCPIIPEGCPVWEDLSEILLENHRKSYLEYLLENGGDEGSQRPDLYSTRNTYEVCMESCSRLCQMVLMIYERSISSGIALLRPPGHHAKRAAGGGFCHINTVAAAAKFAVRKGKYKKVLIIDFDIHHGEGTQELTYNTDTILYVSMHRFDKGKFFPKGPYGSVDHTGEFPGLGYNVNIAYDGEKMENADYIFTWIRVVLPLAYSYKPEIIIISAGFDAGINDPLGGGYKVSPETFGHLIQLIKPVAPVLLALEGGYNKETTSLGVVNCAKALVGLRIPFPTLKPIKCAAATAMQKAIEATRRKFSMMQVYKSLDPAIKDVEDLRRAGVQ